jgi:hypothetical protein
MINSEVKSYSLSDWDAISPNPGEDFYLYIDMPTDQSAVTPTILVGEYEWPYMSNVYQLMAPEEITAGFIIEDTPLIINGRIRIKITIAMSQNWQNRKLWLKLFIDDGTDKWCAASRTLAILNRN